jgi:hypothetical protein
MAYAEVTDVARELGRAAANPDESEQWAAWIDRVERSIVRRFARAGLDLDEQVLLDNPSADDVADVEVARVVDKIRNPNTRQTSVTRSVDDGSITYRNEGGDYDTDPLAITAAEWAILLPGTETGAYSTRPGFEPDTGESEELQRLNWT